MHLFRKKITFDETEENCCMANQLNKIKLFDFWKEDFYMDNRKGTKRFLEILLSVCMLLTMLPISGITAFAAGEETVISSDTTWSDTTLSGTVRINSGVTLTISGEITISGTVTITGGGTVVRGSSGAYFKIGSGASLTVDGVTVDGNSTSSIYSMFDVNSGTLALKNSTVQNCVKSTSYGGAMDISGGTLTIENTIIKNCSATNYGGAIYLADGTDATINSGTFSGNKTTSSGSYGGGFIYNRVSTLTIKGGTFQNNSSAARGGAIYNAGLANTKTYIRNGVFLGNTSSYSGYEGSGAIFFSSENTADTVLYISGSVRFGDGTEHGGQDGILLGTNSSYDVLRKTQISSVLQYPIHIYLACAENRVIAEGVEGYTLTAADMTQLQFHDIGSTGGNWYAWLNSQDNEVYLSATRPNYVLYDANGATGAVTDNNIYTSDNVVTVKSADGLAYEGYTFKGWNTEKDGTGTTYQPGDTFNINTTTTLYAQWEKTFTVTLLNGDGYTVATESGSSSPVEKGGSYSFTLELADRYYKTDSFAVKANGTTLKPDADGIYTISNITSNQTVTVEGVVLDQTAPMVEIQLGKNKWSSFFSSITFDLFLKDTQTVTISATDSETGIAKMEYFVSDTSYKSTEALEETVKDQWKPYSASLSIEPNSKNIIYAKVTDNVGNVGYASSQGIILYTDAVQKTQSVSFTKRGTADVTAEVTLNGNTIDKIYCGESLLQAGTNYTVDGGKLTFKATWLDTLSAGDYTLTLHYNPLGEKYVSGDGNNDAPATTSITLKVQKATGSVMNLSDISKVYDGKVVSDVTYNKLSTGSVAVEYKLRGADDNTYTSNKPYAVGKYTVRVMVAADGNYTEARATADFDITYLSPPADPFDLSGTQGDNGWYTSDVTITPPEGYTVSSALNGKYSDSLIISASTENVSVYLKNEQGQMTDAVSVGNIKIDKDAPAITVSGNTNNYLKRDTVKITASDSTSGIAKVEVKKDGGEFVDITDSYKSGYTVAENGTYKFRVTDNAGRTEETALEYNRIDTQKPVVTIDATHGGETYTSGIWTHESVMLTPENETANLGTTTYQYRVDGGDWQEYISSVAISTDTDHDGTVYEFKAISESGVESDVVSIIVKRDTVVPDGDITIKESSIRQFLNVITFGLFFNEDVDIAISGKDNLSGVASIQYYRSAEILTENSLTSLTGWTDYNSVIHETAEDAEKFIYYVKVTDKAGNTTIFGSSGATFDMTKPVIDGIVNGSTYYTTQKVTVTDVNLDSVTLNGESATLESGILTLPGDTETTYTITAMDKAGNSTTVTVTMKTIASLAEDMEGLTAANVTSADEETITLVKTAAGNVDTESTTDEEQAALKGIIDNCDYLLGKIDMTMQEISDVTGSVGGYDTDSIKLSDKADMETLIQHIDTLLNNDNLTETERENLEDAKSTAEDLMEQIIATVEEIAAVANGIDGYDEETVKSSDKETIEMLICRIDALVNGQHLTETERQNLETVKDTAETLLNKLSEMAEAGDTENIQNVQDVTPNNVKPEDKVNLEAAKEDIGQALNDYAYNYTEDEKEQFEETLKQIEEALEVIQRVEEAEEAIGVLPESVSPNDTEAEEQIKVAKEQYDALSEYEKTLISDKASEKLETLLMQLGDYRIIEGNGSTWTKGSSDGLTFTANGAYGKFMGIEIDGIAISTENYTADSGSMVITLKLDYLNMLTAEEHAITVLYTDGETVGTFTIAEKPVEPTGDTVPADEDADTPETGDNFHIVPWIILMLTSGGAVSILFIKRRSKKA